MHSCTAHLGYYSRHLASAHTLRSLAVFVRANYSSRATNEISESNHFKLVIRSDKPETAAL